MTQVRGDAMLNVISLVGFVLAAALGLSTIPAAAAVCDIKKVVETWTSNGPKPKPDLASIRVALKNLTKKLPNDPNYVDGEFGGPAGKAYFSSAIATRQ